MDLLVIDRKRMTVVKATSLEEADKLTAADGLGVECIEQCIEEYGRCDGYEFTIIPAEWEARVLGELA